MNERIRELAMQAGMQEDEFAKGNFALCNDDIEKFAELIIQESVRVIR